MPRKPSRWFCKQDCSSCMENSDEEDPEPSSRIQVSHDLSKLFNNEQFSDVTFVLKKLRLHAHKAVLCARCPLFYSNFDCLMIENSFDEINITDMEDEVFQEFLRFVYSGIVHNISNISNKLIYAADKYVLNDLKNLCILSLIQSLNVNNAIETLILANQLNAEQLKLSTLKLINKNGKSIISTEGYTLLVKSYPNLLDQLYRHIFISTSSETITAPTDADKKLGVAVDMGKLVNNQKHSDVKIILKDSMICAHKAILSSRNAVFSAMFQHEMTEKSTNTVNITDIRGEVFQELLRFIYTGTVTNIENFSSELLIAAEKYNLEDLKNVCCSSLERCLSIDNAAETLILADRVNAKNLKLDTMQYINGCANLIFLTTGYELLVESHMHLIEELYRHNHGDIP